MATDIPQTVRTALEDRPVDGRVCLEAGAGVGNTAAGLLDAGASRVYAVTNDPNHARTVRERVGRANDDRLAVVEGDLRNTPLSTDSVDLVTAHGLCNVVPPDELVAIAREVSRVARPDGHLVVDDYAPPPPDADVCTLFGLENAAAAVVDGRPALTFYPAAILTGLFEAQGWSFDRERTLLDPVPWTAAHLQAHANAIRERAASLPQAVGKPLEAMAEERRTSIGSERAGRMYSLAFRREAVAGAETELRVEAALLRAAKSRTERRE